MKWIPDYILYSILIVFGAGLIALAVMVARNNNITKVNAVNRQARKAYVSANYKGSFHELTYLVDTLNFSNDEAKLDLAHSSYLAIRFDSLQKEPNDSDGTNASGDSTALKNELPYVSGLAYYDSVNGSSDQRLSSIAFNQQGVSTYKLRDISEESNEDQLLTETLGYFKSALEKDPTNEFARYNYELLKKRIQYPEMTMAKVRSLVHQRKYAEARRVLRNALQRDIRMQKNYSDYVQRLDNVISIDSLSRS
jgi:hypothetical protein